MTRESTIPTKNVGRCPQGGCRERHDLERNVTKLEVKFGIIMAGIAAILGELTLLIFKGVGV